MILCLKPIREHNGQHPLERLFAVNGVRHLCGHDQRFASLDDMRHTADRKASGALEHSHHCVAGGVVRADLLALVKREQRNADRLVLRQSC